MEQEKVPIGKVIGAALLVAGCCVGAGMLGLPVLTAPGGFIPTLAWFGLSWVFMATTGLLFLEVNLWFREDVSIVTMAGKTLGWVGKAAGWLLFVFLFYSLMIAYVSGSGQLFTDFIGSSFSVAIPEWVGGLLLSFVFGIFLYFGTQTVDLFNRFLMSGLIASYFVLIGVGLKHVNSDYLRHTDWHASFYTVPAMIISFGYHNLVPSLTTYLKHDARKLRIAILTGSAIPLLIYLMWEYLILGLVPIEGEGGFREALSQGDMATRVLRNAVGSAWVVDFAETFAFFAIVTSFLSVALSLVDFLADGLKIKKNAPGKLALCFLSLAPPTALSVVYPKIFLGALSYAGAFGAVLLFGVLPACMVWSGRYIKKVGSMPLVAGGRATLVAVILFSLFVFSIEIVHQWQK